MKTAVVTGGAHGIGKSIVLNLLNQEHQVIVLDVNQQYMNVLKAEYVPNNLHTMICDVGLPQKVSFVMQEIGARFGKIDYLINNAGISAFTAIDEISIDTWNRILTVNLSGMFFTAKYGKPFFANNSAIVNIASTRALMSEPHGEAYGASKGGIVALTHALSISLAPKTRVNCISPGWIAVNDNEALSKEDHLQHPAGRVGKGDDIAEMVAFLLSEKAGFITGQNFTVDGGMTKKMIYV
ncbi:MAG: SDR family oxidoreductase [Cytophagaceae bacterium]|jgi:NAD(P)-dependent dehydrogenase (short-subunit alcohol dehydrogenase family)|nr:SDR family oxidoreductase [Cytophagaceae bacterium]